MFSGSSTSTADVNSPTKSTLTGGIIGAGAGAAVGSALATPAIGAVIGGVAGGAIGNFIGKNQTLLQQIEASGVRVFQVGDEVRLVLRADQFFVAGTPQLNPHSTATLDSIVTLLNRYPNASMRVAAYTDSSGSPERNFALSKQWAQSIAKYFWSHGIDTRVLYAVGEGACSYVASNRTAEGRSANRRIEISFRVLEV
ncbi:MAG: OmpA family protein [Pseudomonadota bacterium]